MAMKNMMRQQPKMAPGDEGAMLLNSTWSPNKMLEIDRRNYWSLHTFGKVQIHLHAHAHHGRGRVGSIRRGCIAHVHVLSAAMKVKVTAHYGRKVTVRVREGEGGGETGLAEAWSSVYIKCRSTEIGPSGSALDKATSTWLS